MHFYPRSPCGERQQGFERRKQTDQISIHALLAESDSTVDYYMGLYRHFYPRSPCGERPTMAGCCLQIILFLSTLSLRRATLVDSPIAKEKAFLSTLSLRRATHYGWSWYDDFTISIHALLAESDLLGTPDTWTEPVFLSTLSLRRATKPVTILGTPQFISIHALLAESDFQRPRLVRHGVNFYPRSPCGERRILGRRLWHRQQFLSTLSLRRATGPDQQHERHLQNFYPRSPCGERP